MTNNHSPTIFGVDVAKASLSIWDSVLEAESLIDNNQRAIASFLKRAIKQYGQIEVILEPTGGYETSLVMCCLKLEVPVARAHPNFVKSYAKSCGLAAKTDKIDGCTLSNYRQEQFCKITYFDETYGKNKELSEMLSARNQLVCMLQAERCRLKQTFHSKVAKKLHQRLIKQLEKELKQFESSIDDLIAQDDEQKHKRDLLETVKGVGSALSRELIINLPELGKLNKYEIARLVGVAPINRDSGKMQGHRHIQGGRHDIRKTLYMGALTAIKWEPRMKAFYDGLRARGKLGKVAIVAVMRKMICTLNAMIRDNRAYAG